MIGNLDEASESLIVSGGALLGSSRRAEERFARLPVFSESDYFALNPDVAQAGAKASEHALLHASREGRAMFLQSAIARAYGSAALESATSAQVDEVTPQNSDFTRIAGCFTIFVSSMSGIGHKDLASSLQNDFLSVGYHCELLDETANYLEDHGTCIFVAPHDFFFKGLGQLWQSEQIIAESYVLNTETISSESGMRALPIILSARGVLDISVASHWIWRSACLPSFIYEARVRFRETWLQPRDCSHPLFSAMPVVARKQRCNPFLWRCRPVDVFFFGDFNKRRSAFFAQSASVFSQFKGFSYLRQGSVDREPDLAHERIVGHLSCKAKVTLHISEDGLPAFYRPRIINQTLAGGSVLVSDTRFLETTCLAGVHYFNEDSKHIPHLIKWLIEDSDGQKEAEMVRRAVFDLIQDTNRDVTRPKRLVSFLMSVDSDHAER